jgi:hypothetical protein
MTDIPDEIMQRARVVCAPSFSGAAYVNDAQHVADVARALMEAEARGCAAAREQAAKVAKCASDDRPRRDNIDWNDGYQDGCRAAEAAIRAMEPRDE